jgi:tetratricopeptide (TPR) repeat protein
MEVLQAPTQLQDSREIDRATALRLAPALREGMLLQARGCLLEAAECYRSASANHPDDAQPLLLLGILARQSGQPAAAVRLLAETARRMPMAAHVHLNLALAHLAASDATAAQFACRRACSLDPHSVRAWCALGQVEAAAGREHSARAAYQRAMRLPGGAAPGAIGLGRLLAARKQHEEALAVYSAALRLAPADANLHFAAGLAARALGRSREAQAAYRKALARRPDFAEAHLGLGNALTDEGNFLGALPCYRRALQARPAFAPAWCALAGALAALGRHDEAEQCYRRALVLRPDSAGIHHNLGYALMARKDYARAELCFREALRLDPGEPKHHDGLGNALLQQRSAPEAESCYRRALEIEPDFAASHTNLGNALAALGRHAEADLHYRRGLELEPENPGANYNFGLSCLRAGRLEEGFRRHEFRFDFRELRRRRRVCAQPQWQGQPLAGETVLFHAEQGHGDTIMFARYLPLAAARGCRVAIEVQPRLRRLLGAMPMVEAAIVPGERPPRFDHHCPMMSLAFAFATRLETIPAAVPYLRPDPAEVAEAWRLHPRRDVRPRVGLAWAGNPKMKSDWRRSTTLEALAPILEFRDAVFFSLQFGPAAGEIARVAARSAAFSEGRSDGLVDACSNHRDFAETAALMATLDLVVSVDTSIAHLAGAMGLPLWVMLPHLADWRWLDGREDSPWYPTARLFRQPRPDDWRGVAEGVAAQLEVFAGCSASVTDAAP